MDFSTQFCGSMLIRRGRPKVSTTNCVSVPTTSTFWVSVFPSVSTLNSTGMRNRSRSCPISPIVLKPLLLPSRYTAYLLLNCGAPVPSTHCAKKAVNCCWLCASATFSKSAARIPLSVYWLSAPFSEARNALSPISQRSMWKIIAPFSSVID